MGAIKDIATDPTATYHRYLELENLLGQAADARLFPAMEHIHRNPHEAEAMVLATDYLKCPHCEAECETITAHDVAHRHSSCEEPDFINREVSFYYDSSDFEGFVYLCTSCDEPVSLPATWTEV